MRSLLLSILILLSANVFSQSGIHQKIDEKLQFMDLSELETGFLYDRTYPVAGMKDDSYADKAMDATYFLQAYAELSESDYLGRFRPIAEVKRIREKDSGDIGMGLLNVELEYISQEAVIDGRVYMGTDGYIYRSNSGDSPFIRKHIVIIAPLQKVHEGLDVKFALDSRFLVEASVTHVESIALDLGDGFMNLGMDGVAISHSYPEAGKYDIHVKITLSDGTELFRNSKVQIRTSVSEMELEQVSMRTPGQVTPTLTVNANIAYQGYTESTAIKGRAQAKAYLDNIDGVFDKPIILMDGFDPGDGRTIEDIYSLLDFGTNGENLADMVRDEGYDVVLLNFPTYIKNNVTIDGGADYIQRNAMVLVEAIKKINARKVGNEELVVIGPSMGGLIARYALRYMEMNGINHQTRLYVSFDSPHLGANIPIGAQYLINYYGYEYGDQATQDLVNQALRSAAAKEMLLDHVDGHLANNSNVEQNSTLKLPAGSPGFRSVFQAELDAMGFPQNCRNISLVNGSGTGVGIETANALALNTTFDIAFSVSADATVRYTPAAGNTNTICSLNGYILWFIPVFNFSATSRAYPYTDGYDSSPGGSTDIASTISSFGESGGLIDPNDLLVDNFSFIPVFSSLAITGDIDQHAAVNPASVTAFDAYYAPSANEDHVTLTQANVDFVLDEIYGVSIGNHRDDAGLFDLRSTMVNEELNIKLLGNTLKGDRLTLRIMNSLGQEIVYQNINADGLNIQVPITLNTGVYMIEMSDGKRKEVERFIVR